MFKHILWRTALIAVAAIAWLPNTADAQSQNDLTTPTAWWWMDSATPAEITNRINLGYRLVDLETTSTSPLRFAASFVRNTGDYAKGWWWLYDSTSANITAFANQNNGRIVDIEPYETAAGIRYAAILIPNTGSDFAVDHGWYTNISANQVISFSNLHPTRRIVSLEVYEEAGQERYAYLWVTNTGTQQSNWWYLLGATTAQINNLINQEDARLIDLEEVGNGRYSALFKPNDGQAWYYLLGVPPSQIQNYSNQLGSRIVDIEPRSVTFGGARFDLVLRRNDNDLAIETNLAMRDGMSLDATSGFLLRRLDGVDSTTAGIQESRQFEPASLMKTAHHFATMRQVATTTLDLTTEIVELTGLNGSCPTFAGPVLREVKDVLRSMMEQSSNTATTAIQQRVGSANIINLCAQVGATGIELNHTIGCLCGNPRNQARLLDFATIHSVVQNGYLGSLRDRFYDYMSNGGEFGQGSNSTQATLNSELASSSLSFDERQAFRSALQFAHKGGSYTCTAAPEQHRSVGALVKFPFLDDCEISYRDYFIGAWVNDETSATRAENSVGIGITTLYAHVLRQAIDSWESPNCALIQNYCTAVPNSTGVTGIAHHSGTSLLNADNLVLRARRLPANAFGYLIAGGSTNSVPLAGGGEGTLCVGGSIGRFGNSLASTGSQGTLSVGIDPNAIPTPSGNPASVSSGQTLYFQWWHRDSSSTGAPTSNFTNGLRVTFI